MWTPKLEALRSYEHTSESLVRAAGDVIANLSLSYMESNKITEVIAAITKEATTKVKKVTMSFH